MKEITSVLEWENSPFAGKGITGESIPGIFSGDNLRWLWLIVLVLSSLPIFGQVGSIDKLEQSANGKATSVSDPTTWVTGIVNQAKAHYAEDMSIPYRLTVSNLTPGITYSISIGYDTQKDSKHTIDFLTSYDYVGTHGTFNHGSLEVSKPLEGSGLPDNTVEIRYVIPTPGSEGSLIPDEPTNTHAALLNSDKEIAIFNGIIVDMGYSRQDDLSLGTTSSFLEVKFQVNTGESKVVIAWGGHIAAASLWGQGFSASAVNGAAYHTFLGECDPNFLSGCGQKEVQLQASAVIPPPSCSITGPADVCSGGGNETYTANILNGDNPTYLWVLTVSGGSTASYVSGQGTSSYTVDPGDTGGSYKVELTVTNANTLSSSCEIITNVGEVSASAVGSPADCNGASTGSIALTVTGGTGSYTYAWTKTGDPSFTSTVEDPTNLSAGSYSVTVTDANNCQQTASATVGQPAVLTANAVGSPADCNGASTGSIALTVTGGTGSYTYAWTKTGDPSFTSTVEDPTSLSAGSYSVTVTDANNCQQTASATVGQPAVLTANAVGSPADCNGASTGSIALTVTGGTGSYTYAWTKTGDPSFTSTLEDPTNLSAGSYSVTVTDANNCQQTASATVGQPAVLTANAVGSPADCNGASTGSIALTVTGGTGSYTYAWTKTGDLLFTSTVEDPTNLSAGSYSVTVTDANNCQQTASATVGQPAVLTANAVGSPADCNGASTGSIALTVTGGTGSYTYAWTKTGDPSFTSTLEDPTNLSAGSYSVTVTDANNCQQTASATVGQPAVLTANAVGSPADCNGASTGSIALTVTGGTGSYTYAWTKTGDPSFTSTLEDPTNLSAGSYSVTVTDANNCQQTASATVGQPAVLTANAVGSPADCNGASTGSIALTVTGGTGSYTYAWTKTGDLSFTSTLEDPTNLSAGSYSVTVTDANSCQQTASATVGQPAVLTINAVPTDESCISGDGSIALSVTGGTGSYTYMWTKTGDLGYSSSAEDPTGLSAGEYSVTVTDGNLCQKTNSVTIDPPSNCAHIFPTGTTCMEYNSDPETYVLHEICLTIGDGVITNTNPGAFFYYGDFTAMAGQSSITIDQTQPSSISGYFDPVNESNVHVYDEFCKDVKIRVDFRKADPGDVEIHFNMTEGQRYIVSVKYDPKSIIGETVTEDNNLYSFGIQGYGGSFGTINAVACKEDSKENITSFTDSKQLESVENDQNDIAVYPVPFTDVINVGYDFDYTSDVHIEIFDFGGNLLKTVKDSKITRGSTTSIGVDFSISGNQMYMMRITTEKETYVKQIISSKD